MLSIISFTEVLFSVHAHKVIYMSRSVGHTGEFRSTSAKVFVSTADDAGGSFFGDTENVSAAAGGLVKFARRELRHQTAEESSQSYCSTMGQCVYKKAKNC